MAHSTSLEDQFLAILEQHKKIVFKIANIYSQDSDERKDLIPEIILQLWRAFPNYNPAYSFSTWLYRIALNVSISFYRKEKTRRKTYQVYGQQLDLLVWNEEETDDKMGLLYKLIEGLKPLDKALIILSLEGHTHKQIAHIMGISETNVSSRMHRIKRQLSLHVQPLQSNPNNY